MCLSVTFIVDDSYARMKGVTSLPVHCIQLHHKSSKSFLLFFGSLWKGAGNRNLVHSLQEEMIATLRAYSQLKINNCQRVTNRHSPARVRSHSNWTHSHWITNIISPTDKICFRLWFYRFDRLYTLYSIFYVDVMVRFLGWHFFPILPLPTADVIPSRKFCCAKWW